MTDLSFNCSNLIIVPLKCLDNFNTSCTNLPRNFRFNPFIYKYSCEACNTLENKYEYQLHIEGVAMCLGKCTEIVSPSTTLRMCNLQLCVYITIVVVVDGCGAFPSTRARVPCNRRFVVFNFPFPHFPLSFFASLSVFHLTFELRFVRGIAAR